VNRPGLTVTQSISRTYRLSEIVARLGGELIGDPDAEIRRIATLESARSGDLCFLSHARYRAQLRGTRASAVILAREERDATALPRILCDDPYVYYARAAQLFGPESRPVAGVHVRAVVEAGAEIPASATVGPGCHIGRGARLGERTVIDANCTIGEDAEIGEDSRLGPSVTVYPRCLIGKRALIHAGVVIGADGFGMASDAGRWIKIPQTGRALIGDDVEIGANTTIDRGALDDTVIEDGVKLDNQIQIGHNVRIGAHTAVAGCAAVAGSTRIGAHCAIGGAARIFGHLTIADHVTISAAAVVTKSITRAGTYTGALPSAPSREWAKTVAHLRGLDRLVKRIRELEKRLPVKRKR
ncbi:MAG TPA: UDP-3-O-(3-hydroxymyristoyl)glucosamine N-acyltransferase, partial [Burkholderiales bacterium]|nr:UDP-3-O-(3-hydroxymyristoyl)glucosamine N-acyltransferase [Burkholderiales bacterium]